MKRINILILFTGVIFFSSCVSMKQFSDVQDKLKKTTLANEKLKQENIKLKTANNELTGANQQFSEQHKRLSAQLEEALYESNKQKQQNHILKNDINKLNQQLEIIKSGSTTEIEQLLKELQIARQNLNEREDRLLKAGKDLQIKNAKLIELQNVLAQKDKAVKDLKDKVINALTGFTNNGLTVHEKNGKVYVSMEEQLLFKTGKWDVDPKGQQALHDLSKVLAENPNINIMVEGHTDDVPMHGLGDVKDNWDLSAMRATAVTKILTQNRELNPQRIISAGRSKYLPLVEGSSPEDRQMNRRTEIILTPKLDELLEILEDN